MIKEMTIQKAVLIISIIGLTVYGNSLFNDFVWDDQAQITNNTLVHSLTAIPQIFTSSTFGTPQTSLKYYRPLMSSVFTVLYSLGGNNAVYFHLFSIFLHISNTILVFLLLKTFIDKKIALFISLIFLVHPMNVEAVGYTSSLMELLFFFFGMLVLLVPSKILMSISLLLSLLSKETGILFVPLLALRKHTSLLSRLPAVLLSIGTYLLFRLGIAGFYFSESGQTPIFEASLVERLGTIPKVIFYYIQTFFLPIRLSVLQEWTVKAPTIADFYIPLLAVTLFFIAVLSLGMYIRSKAYFFFMLWFVAGLLFHSQVFPLDMTVADRWFYFPMLGLLGMIGIAVQKLKNVRVWLGIFIILFSVRSIARTFDWRDNLTLFSRDVRGSASANLEFNLGATLLKTRRVDEAKIHIARAIELVPTSHMRAYYEATLANISGNQELAKEKYRESIQLGNSPLAYAALSNLIYMQDSWEEAMEFVRVSLPSQPTNAQLWLNLALLEYERGNRDKALDAAQKAYELSPTTDGLWVLQQIEEGRPIYK